MRLRAWASKKLGSLKQWVDGEIWSEVFDTGGAGVTLEANRPRRFATLDQLKAFVEVVQRGIGGPSTAPTPGQVTFTLSEANSDPITCLPDEAGFSRLLIPRKSLQMQVTIHPEPQNEALTRGLPYLDATVTINLDRYEGTGAITRIEDSAGGPTGAAFVHGLAATFASKTVPVRWYQLRRAALAVVDPIDSAQERRDRINGSMKRRATFWGLVAGLVGGWISSGGMGDAAEWLIARF